MSERLMTRLVNPLRSRGVRVALATVIVAYLAEWGVNVSDSIVYTILGVGVALILKIGIEDAGEKAAPPPPATIKISRNGEPGKN